MIVQTNISALNANRQLNIVRRTGSKSAEKLSSGYKINRAADDAAGLSISEKMRRQIRGLTKAGENVEDGISLCQVADGAMAEMQDMTNRMNELCVQAANGTNSASDRAYIQMEIDSIVEEFGRIINTTKFNEVYIFRGDEKFHGVAGQDIMYDYVEVDNGTGASGIGSIKGIKAYGGNSFGEVFSKDNDLNDDSVWRVTDPSKRYLSGGKYPISDRNSAWIDFTDFKADSKADFISKLNGEGFDWSCCRCSLHGCVKFVSAITGSPETSPGGIEHEYLPLTATPGRYSDEIVKIDLNSIWDKYESGSASLGETICEVIIDVLNYAGDMTRHPDSRLTHDFVAFANKKGTGKIYLVDAQGLVPSDMDSSEFSLTARNDDGKLEAGKILELKPVPPKVRPITTRQLDIHAGTETDGNNKVIMRLPTFTNKNLTINGVSALTEDLARNSLDVLTDVQQVISAGRSRMGAYQNRLEHTSLNLDNIVENTTDSESKIRDTDMAEEMVRYSNNTILMQAGQSMLSQANNSRQGILSLLAS